MRHSLVLPLLLVACGEPSDVDGPAGPGASEPAAILDGQPVVPPPNRPAVGKGRLEFEETSQDLGQIEEGAIVPLAYPFRVVGEEPVIVTSMRTSCGCTNASLFVGPDQLEPGTPLEPGTVGEIRAEFKSKGFRKRKDASITLLGNGIGMPQALALTVYIRPTYDIEPPVAVFHEIPAGTEASASVRVRSAERLEIVEWQQLPPGVAVGSVGESVRAPDGVNWDTQIELLATADAPEGALFGQLRAQTTMAQPLDLRYSGRVVGPVLYRPDRLIAFGLVPKATPAIRNLDIQARQADLVLPEPSFRISGSAADRFQAELQTLDAGRHYRLKLRLKEGLGRGRYDAQLRVTFPDSGLSHRDFTLTATVRS